MSQFYGYFSQKQKDLTGHSNIYTTLDPMNAVMEVTEINRSMDHISEYDDSKFVGLVQNLVQKISNGKVHYLMQLSDTDDTLDYDLVVFDWNTCV